MFYVLLSVCVWLSVQKNLRILTNGYAAETFNNSEEKKHVQENNFFLQMKSARSFVFIFVIMFLFRKLPTLLRDIYREVLSF